MLLSTMNSRRSPSPNKVVIHPVDLNQRPDIIRPIPLRLSERKSKSAMIHPHMVQGFHQQCEEAGLNQEAIHAAVEQSEEWHRRWTLQDEEGHTMPHHVSWRTDGANDESPLSCSSWDSLEVKIGAFESPVLRPLEAPPLLSPLTLPPTSFHEEEEPPYIPPCLFFPREESSVLSGWESASSAHKVEHYKEALYHALSISGGETSTQEFNKALLPLIQTYHDLGWDARYPKINKERKLEGMWFTLSKATFFGCLGENGLGDPMYTLGRMAFDMFLPTQLVCSIQGNFNPVHILPPDQRPETIPRKILEQGLMGDHVLRTYK